MSKRHKTKEKRVLVNLSEASARIEKARIGHATELDLSGLGLTEVPGSIGQLTQLQILYLSGNQLTALPDSIGQLTQLQILYLHDNQLTAVPNSIARLTQLKELSLSGNQLTAVPNSIARLTQLQILYLYGNQLTALPDSIGQLTELKELSLQENKLEALPESMRKLESLQRLYLHENDALGLPKEVLGSTWHEPGGPAKPAGILEYYFRMRGGRRPLNEAKLILVGRGAVGKTSIVNKLVRDHFDKDEKKTEGINITVWPVHLHTGEDVRLNVWDFGGQEIMHATHQFFLTARSVYLLVLNGREGGEDADAEYWLKLIESFGNESPVIVVMNKIKEHPFDLNRRALQQKYMAIREFIKTDCKDGSGFDQLRKAIERETDRLEHLRDSFPANWFTIKDKLSGIEKNYLSFDEYRDVCAQYGETDKEAQELLTVYLHNLGIALNYKDDLRLQDTHVLNPHWVTNGIYKVLNSEKLEKQQGVIRLDELSAILDEGEYPRNMHLFIFDLMKKFELCFNFPDKDTHYLIPELLDKQEPEQASEFDPQQCLNFQYHYPVLPEGLLPRFIVRTHTLSEGLPRWRTGAILKFKDSRALVKADAQDRKVSISISGPAWGRRELLAIIRSDFEQIHRDISNLNPQEMIPVPNHTDTVVPYDDLILWESEGRPNYAARASGRILDLNVRELLDGVNLAGTRKRDRSIEHESEAVQLFISYSRKDKPLRDQLHAHLKLLQWRRIIDVWDDCKIDAGEEWKRKIDDNLERADIILLLVSADFMASDYCYENEMTRALERHNNNEARVIPVIVRAVSWNKAPFAELQALPEDGRAVTSWPDTDLAWTNVAVGIEKAVEQIKKSRDTIKRIHKRNS